MTLVPKTPYEEFWRTHSFASWLAEGETIASCTVTVTATRTGEAVPSMVSDVAPYGAPATQVLYFLKGGTQGKYGLSVKIVTSNSQKFEDRLEIQVSR